MSQIWQAATIHQRYPLADYLTNAWLPSFRRSGRRCLTSIARANPWPKYPELQRKPGTRCLVNVVQIKHDDFMVETDYFIQHIKHTYLVNEAQVEEEESFRLRLPSEDMVVYDDEDVQALSQINNEDDLILLVQNYVLTTISEVIRLVEGISLDDPVLPSLKFSLSSALCPAHHARWDIFTLPRNVSSRPIPLAVFFVPPWEFGIQDFQDFTRPQSFSAGVLDRLDTKAYTAADKLWAVVHDTCVGRGKFFVVTNYIYWAFGKLDSHDRIPNAIEARITDPFEAPILEFDGTHAAVPAIGFTAIEALAFWIHHALTGSQRRTI